ncbi:glyceraldehyde-3-phosphate dehydrogenase 1 [Clydaea vesicula]|uniref:Glyceraldehyde-3-phosphate dehydrogenase 1 n=1 Tax=Clydaea vesicula TaxID=447962 RepID=A0AAD5U518_9FUNG|nr:glyceraldehyde-3-phosphate dehydrogenase 1 [Clydaea vesicula]
MQQRQSVGIERGSTTNTNRFKPSHVAKAAFFAAQNGLPLGSAVPSSPGGIGDRRYSVAALWSMAAENDLEVDDDLTKAQRRLRELKAKISGQSKKNFLLERDVRYLDSRIALLIQNRMALDEQQEVAAHLEEHETTDSSVGGLDDRKRQLYGNLFYLLQAEPRHIATLARLVSLGEIDTLLQTVMFTIYGNQYESREEYLLLSMFQNVLAAQFEMTTEFGSLLRANTPVSRMMTTYTRRGPGQTYLKDVLSERINNLLEHVDLDLEINPLKVYEQMIVEIELETGQPSNLPRGLTLDEAQENPDVQAIIKPRLSTLEDIANSFLTTIIESLDKVPYGIRWICKQIKSLTKRKYPDASDFNIGSLIGGFFMLRFVNPAIVTPHAYMLVDKNPSKHPGRTLTLVVKMLQNLANKPSYSKEKYMMALNGFVEANKARINKFFTDLCEVSDFYEALEMEQYIALSKKEISLNISLNEMFNTQSLLLQHSDILCPEMNHHLRICLNDLGQCPAQLPRSENKSVVLPLFSRWETPIIDPLNNSDSQLTQGDILYMDTKSIFVQVLRTIPALVNKNLSLHKVAEVAATSKDQGLVKKGLKVRDMLSQLEELGILDSKDGHKLMVEEVLQELVHLGNLRDTVNRESKSLDLVYKTIIDHNNYLRSQLESYKAYLQNVRVQAGASGTSKTNQKTSKTVAPLGPFKFSHSQLEKEGIIVESNVPEVRRANIYFNMLSPVPGTYIITLHYKGREKAILEMDLKLDDLLEKQQLGVNTLDLEYVHLSVQAEIITELLGVLIPAYCSIHALERSNIDELKHWVAYWSLFSCVSLLDFGKRPLLKLLPFYFAIKLILCAFLAFPQLKGGMRIHLTFIKPLLIKKPPPPSAEGASKVGDKAGASKPKSAGSSEKTGIEKMKSKTKSISAFTYIPLNKL